MMFLLSSALCGAAISFLLIVWVRNTMHVYRVVPKMSEVGERVGYIIGWVMFTLAVIAVVYFTFISLQTFALEQI